MDGWVYHLNWGQLKFTVLDFMTLNPWVISVAMLIMGALLIGFLMIRKSRKRASTPLDPSTSGSKIKKRRYEFRLCIIGDKHRWIKTTNDSLTFSFTDPAPPPSATPMAGLYDGRAPDVYDIDPTVLYELAPSIRQKMGMFLRGINKMFLVVFNEGKNEPVKYQTPKRSAYVLLTIEQSRALGQALKKEFAGEFSVKRLFMYAVLIIIGVLAYMFMSGQLRI